jgi:tetratricopeptide (TPR) repeat protein
MAEGKYREAIAKFRQATQVKETPGLRYYIAYCHEQLDELLEAKGEYDRAAELLKDFDARDVRALLPEAQARVDKSLAILVISGVGDAEVRLDGNVVGAESPNYVNPGHHEIIVEGPDGTSAKTTVNLGRGESRRLVPEVPRPATPHASEATTPSPTVTDKATTEVASPSAEPSKGASPIVFWSAVGVAALGAGVMSTGLVVRESNASRAQELLPEVRELAQTSGCVDEKPCLEFEEATSNARLGETLAIAGGIGLGVGAASALLVHWLWPARTQERIEARVSPEFVGFSFTRAF